jgi:hypothetical protein
MGYFEKKGILQRIFLICIVIIIGQTTYGQVEHNFPVGSQATNCDSLDITSVSLEEAFKAIENAKFRVQQQFKISRTYGVMSAGFYSCDGKKGFLIMRVDKKDYIYLEVQKSVWDTLITSSDINGFYNSDIKASFSVLTE